MTVIKRTSSYDTWREFFLGQTSKNSYRFVNDGTKGITVVLCDFAIRENADTATKKLDIYPFAFSGVAAGTKTDFTILGKEFIAYFLVDRKVALTRRCIMNDERGFIFGKSVDELVFRLRKTPKVIKINASIACIVVLFLTHFSKVFLLVPLWRSSRTSFLYHPDGPA